MGFIYILGFTISLILSALLYPLFIRYMETLSLNQEVSEYALDEFKGKSKTPTMGGVVFVIVPLVTLLVLNYKAYFQIDVLLVVMAFLANGLIGLYDDYLILVKKDNIGFTTGRKFLLEIFLSIVFGLVWYLANDGNLGLSIPFTQLTINVGWLYFFVIIIMLSGVSNAVNITDGMDGLAGGTVFLAIIPYIFFAINQENTGIALLLFAVLGSLASYLFYNIKPAKVIMGDVGSLSLGALLAASAIVLGYELALIIIGGIFLVNTLTVIIQVGSVKLFSKKVFPYTPIHYSFIIWGIPEKRVVYIFWAIGFVLMLIGLLIGVVS